MLFTVAKGQGSAWDNAQVVAQSLKTGERKTLIERGTDGRYVPTGHIVYGLGGTLFAVPFDVRRLEVTVGPVPVVEGVRTTSFQFGGGLQFSFSLSGTLIYLPGPLSATGEQQVLALMDRKGNIDRLKMPPRAYAFPRVSPDGKRVAFGSDNGKEAHIWVYALNGTIAPRQLTVGNHFPEHVGQLAKSDERGPEFGVVRPWFEELKRHVPVHWRSCIRLVSAYINTSPFPQGKRPHWH